MKHKYQKGFSLLELIIVVTIIGIISAIALPAYRRHVLETNRKAAIAAMFSLQQELEQQYIINNGAYPESYDKSGTCKSAGSMTSGTPPRYALAITNIKKTAGLAYDITATPCKDAGQDADSCKSLTLSSSGETSATGTGNCF